jgi:hypothetical protein
MRTPENLDMPGPLAHEHDVPRAIEERIDEYRTRICKRIAEVYLDVIIKLLRV